MRITIYLVLLLTLLPTTRTQAEIQPYSIPTPAFYKLADSLNLAYNAPGQELDRNDTWIAKLEQCESGGNYKALNPKDLDGTPSKGRFQFKDTTFYNFARKYKIKVTSVWNGDEQEQILLRMIDDPTVNLRQQFPVCTRKIGLPERNFKELSLNQR